MKTARAILTALALMALLAFPALAEAEGDITISVDCEGDPETVTVTNNLEDLPISVVQISSIDDPEGDQTFFVGEEIAAGESMTFESGESADENVLTDRFIFDDENPENEGVVVRIGPEPILDDFTVTCAQGTRSFDVIDDVQDDQDTDDEQDDVADDQQDMPDDMPDTGAGALAAGSGLPWGVLAAAVSLALAGGYGARRRG